MAHGDTPGEPDRETAAEELRAYDAARETLDGWLAGAQALALLRAALASGIFDAAHEPRTPGQVAVLVGLDSRRMTDLCLALDAHGIFVFEDGRYRLSPDFARLAAPGALQSLGDLLDGAAARGRALATVADPVACTALSTTDSLAIARAGTIRPASPLARALYALRLDTMPELRAIGARGGRYLELGCGVGGNVLTLLQLFPALTSVGSVTSVDTPSTPATSPAASRRGRVADLEADAAHLR